MALLYSCACLVFHFSRVNETHSVGVWSFPGVVSSTNKSFTFMNSKAERIIFKLRPGWILTKSKRPLTFVRFYRETANRRRAGEPIKSAVCVILWWRLKLWRLKICGRSTWFTYGVVVVLFLLDLSASVAVTVVVSYKTAGIHSPKDSRV